MRKNPTEPEKRFWRHLSNSQLEGHKFRRQAVIQYYIADFVCPHKRLIIEVDGDTHDSDADFKRDERLKEQGYRTVRFSNIDVMDNIDGVLTALLKALSQSPDRWRKTTPKPSFEKEEIQ
nr:endonuclease domain-containing protein [Parasphingorhabdus halotolerans]